MCGKLVTALIFDVDTKIFKQMKSSLKEANSMFWPDVNLEYMFIELFTL